MKIQCIDQEIKELLRSNFYYIPRFQRPYRWDRENVTDLWQDAIEDPSGDYFIGSIVLFGKDRLGITDGQQRLTTLIMILCAVRNTMAAHGLQNLAQGVQAMLERNDIENKKRFVLETETSYPYYHDHILKFGEATTKAAAAPEERLLKEAFDVINQFITDGLKGCDASTAAGRKALQQYLIRVRDAVLGLKFILVRLENEDDAYTIFETLNARGKNLTLADMVKSYLLKYANPTNASLDNPKGQWNEIATTIEESEADLNVSSFLHHYWLSKHTFVAQRKVFRAIREAVTKKNALEFLNSLVDEAHEYRGIFEVSYREWKREELSVRDSLEALVTFRVKLPVPLLMSVLRQYRHKKAKLKVVREVIGSFEKFHLAFTAVTSQRSSGGIASMYSLHARDFSNASSEAVRAKSVKDLLAKLRARRPSFTEFEADFHEILASTKYTKQKALAVYILKKIDAKFRKGAFADYSRMTIEHIASQATAGSGSLSDEDVARLGNLILIDHKGNEGLGNKPFPTKKTLLRDDEVLKAYPAFAAAKDWGPMEITARTKWMAKIAYEELWRL